jgi:hypothetical protein
VKTPRITSYVARSGATPESERMALRCAWELVFSSYEEQKKKAAAEEQRGRDDVKEDMNVHAARGSLPRRR